MTNEQLESLTYSLYEKILVESVFSSVVKHGGCLAYSDAVKYAEKERLALEKEKKSFFTKISGKMGIGSATYKHSPVPYDMSLCLMKILNKRCLFANDYSYVVGDKNIYENYFRKNLLKYQKYRYSYDMNSLSKEEYELKQREQERLFELAVPPLGKMKIENKIEKGK